MHRLRTKGISIETVVHNNGSPGNGAYWGYLVAHQVGGNSMTYYGRDTKSNGKGLHHPFHSQHEAMMFANSLPTDPEEDHDHDHDHPPHEDPWVDIGGEG